MSDELTLLLRTVPNLSDKDVDRIMECVYCPFAEECYETVKNPEDDEHGRCKTKQRFENKYKGRGSGD